MDGQAAPAAQAAQPHRALLCGGAHLPDTLSHPHKAVRKVCSARKCVWKQALFLYHPCNNILNVLQESGNKF